MSAELFDEMDRETFEQAVETWGVDAQAEMAEEEAAEFIVASKHWARGKAEPMEVVDEVADLRIMTEQLTEYLGRERVEAHVEEKMDCLRERLRDAGTPVSEDTETDRPGGDT